MAPYRSPIFLARHSYRVRRLRDAVRILPMLGAFLWLLPLLWEPASGAKRDLATDAIYIFMIWFGLIILAAVLAQRLGDAPKGDDPEGTEARE